jgi:thioredoxin 1
MFKPVVLGLAAALALTASAFAADFKTFDQAAFKAAQGEGRPILVEVTAPWCPTCRAQKPIIQSLAAAPENAKLVIFNVDFDSRKDVLREFGVTKQSTLIAFKGAQETARSTGSTDPQAIAALVKTAH